MITSIEIVSSDIQNIAGTGKNGKPYSFNKQAIFVHNDKAPYPDKSEILINDGQPPFAPGHYDLHPDSVVVDRNGRLSVQPVIVRQADKKS